MQSLLRRTQISPLIRRHSLATSALVNKVRFPSAPTHPDLEDLELKPVQTEMGYGSRFVILSKPKSGNWITEEVLDEMSKKVDSYMGNYVANMVFFASKSPYVFSRGLKEPYSKENLKKAFDFQRKLNTLGHQSETFAVFDGRVKNSAYGLFSECKYIFASPSTKFSVTSLRKGIVPLGGLAHALVNKTNKSVSFYGRI